MTPTQDQLEQTALLLAEGAQQLNHGTADDEMDQRFGEALARTLDLGLQRESAVLTAAAEALADQGDPDSAGFLFNEVEIEAECQYIEGANGDTLMTVLFAIPVLFPADTPSGAIISLDDIEGFHDLMEQADVISGAARFGLLPYFLPPEALLKRAYGDIRTLTQHLGAQVVNGEGPELGLGTCLPGMHAQVHQGEPILRFLVGVLAVPEDEADGLFFEEPHDEASAFTSWALSNDSARFHHRGTLPDGTLWEDTCAKFIEDNIVGGHPVLAVEPPLGFHEDLRVGRLMLREYDLTERFGKWMAAGGELEDSSLTERPLMDDQGAHVGWLVTLTPEQGEPLFLPWELYGFEEPVDAHGQLMDTLDSLGLLSARVPMMDNIAPGRMLLH